MATAKENKAIGIDLGTTYSNVGMWLNDRVEIIPNYQGNRTAPSYVAFTDTERLIGDAAKNQVAPNPRNAVFDAKRLIGHRFFDSSVQSDMNLWPFKVIPGPSDSPWSSSITKARRNNSPQKSFIFVGDHCRCNQNSSTGRRREGRKWVD